MKKISGSIALLLVVSAVAVFFATTGIVYAACRVDDPNGGDFTPVRVPVTASIDSAVLSGNSLNVQVSGIPGYIITACGNPYGLVPNITLSANIGGATASTIIQNPNPDGYSKTLIVNVSSLSSGLYTLQVTAISAGTVTTNASVLIPYVISKVLPPAGGGTATFSQTMFGIGDSYSFSVSSAPHSVSGDLYKSTDGGKTWAETTGWIQTDSTGNGTKGPWTCNSANDTSVYIKWPDGTKTNTASYSCLPNPTVSLTSSPSQWNRGMGNPITISWNSTNTSQCSGSFSVGPDLSFGIGGTSGNITIPAEYSTLVDTLLEGYPYPGTSNPQSASINSSITCQNSVGKITSDSASTNVFYNNVYWKGYQEPSCGLVSQAQPWPSASSTFSAEIDNLSGERVKGPYTGQTLAKIDNRAWGSTPDSAIFKVVTGSVIPPTGYVYCPNDEGSFTTPSGNGRTTPFNGEVKLYFAPAGGGVPGTPTNFAAGGECRQNYPDTQTQNFLGWSTPASGADSYNVYKDGVFLANTPNTWYIDIFSPAKYKESHDYYVTAKNSSGESAKTNTYTATTPASCTGDPPQPPPGSSPGYLIDPPQQTINAGDSAQYRGLYDPDGNNIRFGNFDVASLASWSVVHSDIAQSLSGGKYLGETSGSTDIGSIYRNITATASLNVQSVSSPDFSISISPATPQYNSVVKPGTTTYAVTISPIGGFNSNVVLSVDNLKSGTTGKFSPTSVNTSGNSTLTLTISSSANVERYTFSVTGTSGSIVHSANADIDITNIPPPGSFSCSLSATPPDRAPTSVSVGITGGVSPYRCYNWPASPFNTTCYGYGTNPTYSCGNASDGCKLDIGVSDKNNATTTCSINIPGNGNPTCNSADNLFINLHLNGQTISVSDFFGNTVDPQFVMSSNGKNFNVQQSDFTNRWGMTLTKMSNVTYKFVSWTSPTNYAVDRVVYENGTADSIITEGGCVGHSLDIYLTKSADNLIIDSYLPVIDSAGNIKNQIYTEFYNDGSKSKFSFCEAQGSAPNGTLQYISGLGLKLTDPSGNSISVGSGNSFQFGTSQLPYGKYTITGVQPPNGYRVIKLPECQLEQLSVLPQNNGIMGLFGKVKDFLVNNAFAQLYTQSILNPSTSGWRLGNNNNDNGGGVNFTAVKGGPDIYVHTYLAPNTDYCTLSASPSSVLNGQSSQLSWSCSKPTGKICTLKDDSGKYLIPAPGKSVTSVYSIRTGSLIQSKTYTYTLSCTGVDPSTATVTVGFLPVIREIIPR